MLATESLNLGVAPLSQLPLPQALPQDERTPLLAENSVENTVGGEHGTKYGKREVKERWNANRTNVLRLLATYWSFVLLGANDSLFGAILPYLESHYHISHTQVSLMFLSPVTGSIISTLCTHSIHHYWGQRGVVLITGSCHLLAWAVAMVHPPFPILVIGYAFVGMAQGAKGAAWNSYVGGLESPNELLGLLHGFYGLGATLTPAVATALITGRGWRWYEFYYVLIVMLAIDMALSLAGFWSQTGQVYREKAHVEPPQSSDPESMTKTVKTQSQTVQCLQHPLVILCSLYLIAYVGSEVSLGGWIVTFIREVRHGDPFTAGLISSGFWGGLSVGRMVLGFLTGRLFKSVKSAVLFYWISVLVMQLAFWLVPSITVSAISAFFVGFFIGPMFPGVITCLTQLLPPHLQVTAVGICCATGATGASIFPFLVGSIAQAKGVWVLHPIIFCVNVMCTILWWAVPDLPGEPSM